MFSDLLETGAYRHRFDRNVPGFADDGSVLFMDAKCLLCSAAARTVVRHDDSNHFLLCTIQSGLGRAVLRHYGQNPDDPGTWLLLDEGRPYTGMDAVIRVATRLGGWFKLTLLLKLLPPGLRERIYQLVARNRYRLFGGGDLCAVSDPELQRRIID